MKRIIRLLICWELLILLGAACENTPSSTSMPSATPEASPNWWETWLSKPACKPPCWQNITPGMTTLDMAKSSLENLPNVKITFKSKDGIDWEFNKNEGGTLTASKDGIVDLVWIGGVSEKKLSLKTIVASYKAPKYVAPYDCREGMCSTALIYPDFGMFLSVFIENKGMNSEMPQVEIQPETVVNRVYFIEPGIKGFLNLYGLQESNTVMDWKGYGEYP